MKTNAQKEKELLNAVFGDQTIPTKCPISKHKHQWDNDAIFAVRQCVTCGGIQQSRHKWGKAFYLPEDR